MELVNDFDERMKNLCKILRQEGGGLDIDTIVECEHCRCVYPAHKMKVLKKDGIYYGYCANYPDCSGSIIDIFEYPIRTYI